MSARVALLASVAERISALPREGMRRVGIDGLDGAGKTTFADELAAQLRSSAERVVRASIDSFHNPRALRYALGSDSPEGYYRDSFDLDTLRRQLLDPLGSGGNGRYRAAAFDHRTDARVDAPVEVAPSGAILVFDGIFLHRPELRPYWDLSVFLRVSRRESLRRCIEREGAHASPDPEHPDHRRYVEGQRLYFAACDPAARATLVVDNEDLANPFIV